MVFGPKNTSKPPMKFYTLPLLLAFILWRRPHVPSRLPPESINRAIVSGARFVFHSATIRKILSRAFLFGLVGATAGKNAPLVDYLIKQGAVILGKTNMTEMAGFRGGADGWSSRGGQTRNPHQADADVGGSSSGSGSSGSGTAASLFPTS